MKGARMPLADTDLAPNWTLAAAQAERGDNTLLAAFLRDQKERRDDVDLALVAGLLDGSIKRPPGRRPKLRPLDVNSKEFAERDARYGNLLPLISLLKRLSEPYDCPDLTFVARVLNGDFAMKRGRPARWPLARAVTEADMRFAVDTYAKENRVSREEAIAHVAQTHPWSESALQKLIYDRDNDTRYTNSPVLPGDAKDQDNS
jgi:hypothetical protein